MLLRNGLCATRCAAAVSAADRAPVLLNDTQLRMVDKLIPALRAELRRHRLGQGSMRRVQGEIFSRDDRLFVTNSEPDLVGNLGTCLARFFRARSLGEV